MISTRTAKAYCRDDISLIENYDKAVSDTTQLWHCHHRRETIFSRKDLIEIGEYYNRPACELIFVTSNEHHRLHHLGKHRSAETRKKMGEAHKGKHHSEEHKLKLSEALKGKNHSEEHKRKLSEALNGDKNPMFGKHLSAETRKKISEANKGKPSWIKGKHHSTEARKKMSESKKREKCYIFGKHLSEETRKKMSEARKGNHWYNNGVTSILAKTCPEGFVPGRIK